jgi:uncharacterized protein involved in exopolysaccharide biosynthesis
VEKALMQMTKWLRVLRRWLWLIAVVVVVTVVVLAIWLGTVAPTYEATAKIGLPTLVERRVAGFVEVLKAKPVRQQTIDQLGLEGTAAVYDLDVKNLGNAGFLELTVVTEDANLAVQIANTHADVAVAYFGVLRAQPAEEDLRVLAEQLDEAQEDLTAAEQAFAEFRTEHAIGSLQERLVQHERNLGALRAERDRRSMIGLSIAGIDETIAQRREQISRLTALAPSYNALDDAVAQAQKVFNQFHNKYIAAELALTAAQATDDIQLIEPARAPAQPVSDPRKLFAMGLASAVGLGIGLAFVLESVFPSGSSQAEQES